MSDDENPGECYSCHFETDAVKVYDRNSMEHRGEKMWLCDLCAGSLAGRAFDYPRQYPDSTVLRTICYVGNAILAELRHATR